MSDLLSRLYRSLVSIRRVEEEVARVYPTDKIKSPVHLSIGQEAVSVGVCEALQPADVVFGSYRSHALYLAKGGDLRAMIAELYGKATGCARGKGGSMHLVDVKAGVMGASAVVATTIPQAVGYAYAARYRAEPTIVVSFFGDGAVDEGVFHESLNFAALKRLPLLFVCENNSYAIHTHRQKRHAFKSIHALAGGYGIENILVEDMDTVRIHEITTDLAARLRQGETGPFFLECHTYRWKEHVGPNEDYQLGYRTEAEAAPWRAADQLQKIAAQIPQGLRTQIESEIEREIEDAFAFAESSPFPQPGELYTEVYQEH